MSRGMEGVVGASHGTEYTCSDGASISFRGSRFLSGARQLLIWWTHESLDPGIGRHRRSIGRFHAHWPRSHQSWPRLPKLGRCLIGFGPVAPNASNELGPELASLAQLWLNWLQNRRTLPKVDGSRAQRFAPNSANLEPELAKFARKWPGRAGIGHCRSTCWSTSRPNWPDSAQTRPNRPQAP